MKLRHILFAMGLASGTTAALADDPFPSHPISVVVGYAPGGGTDIFARVIAERMSRVLKQSLVIYNKAGANGNIGAEQVATAAPDGYTLLFVVSSHVTNGDIYNNLPYDPIKDFSPVGLVVSTPLLLVANPQFPPNNIQELVAYAKKAPGQATFASPGVGSPGHLTIEMLKSMTGVDIQVVHYKGAAPAQSDVIAGHVQMQIPTLAQALPQAKAGRVKILAQTGSERSAQAPSTPTVAESGLPGFSSDIWFALLAPVRTPAPVVARLNRVLNDVLAEPETIAKLRGMGGDPMGGTPERATAVMQADQQKWHKVIKTIGLEKQ